LRRLKDFDTRLAAFAQRKQLTAAGEFDYRMLRLAVQHNLFEFEEAHAFDKNPMTYAEALDFNVYLKRDFAPLAERLRSIIKLAQATPAFLATAARISWIRCRNRKSTLAIEIARGAAAYLAKDLANALHSVTDEKLLADFPRGERARHHGVPRFAIWLEKEKLPLADDHFALGEKRFRKVSRDADAITLAPERILEIGLAELKREQAIFAEAAKIAAPSKAPHEAMRELQRDHPTADALIPDTKRNLEAIRQFLIKREIITIPSEVRATVAETPAYQRAGSFRFDGCAGAVREARR
jgi:hypothetical protein